MTLYSEYSRFHFNFYCWEDKVQYFKTEKKDEKQTSFYSLPFLIGMIMLRNSDAVASFNCFLEFSKILNMSTNEFPVKTSVI